MERSKPVYNERGKNILNWKRISELRESIIKRTGDRYKSIIEGKMMLGWKLDNERLPK